MPSVCDSSPQWYASCVRSRCRIEEHAGNAGGLALKRMLGIATLTDAIGKSYLREDALVMLGNLSA